MSSREIHPTGWLRRQLQIQAEGLSGHLDLIWPDIRDSRWIGKDRDGWERVPYWLDGFIPLAYLLEDDALIARAQRYVDAILDGQQSDGWICPCAEDEYGSYDMWAYFLICKVLVVYHDCSGDCRVEPALRRALKRLESHLRSHTLFGWGSSRWFECLIPIFWLYDRAPEDWLQSLAVTLCVQGFNYKALFAHWSDQLPRREWSFQTHVVNLAMALKSEALLARITGDDPHAFADRMWTALMRYHGTAAGHFTGDECIAGASPIQGTELCSVAEAMYSFEVLFGLTGNPSWLDRLEKLAFNSLPAALSPDMWTHQYDQMINQVEVTRFPGAPIFGTNGGEAHLFGLEPNFGCCTANFNQAWPKFALSTFYRSSSGIVSASLAPAMVSASVNGVPVTVELQTDYPFRGRLAYIVKSQRPVEFDLDIRIPAWAASALVDGTTAQPGALHRIRRCWSGQTCLQVELEFQPVFLPCPDELVCLQRGPLLYSVSIAEEWTPFDPQCEDPYRDCEIRPRSKWNYAFADESLSCEEHPVSDIPFSGETPPVWITANMAEIDWGAEEGFPNVCARAPHSRVPLGPIQKVKLKPYGCTSLRMTQMPMLPH